MKKFPSALLGLLLIGELAFAAPGDSVISRWKDGRAAAVTLTYDDPPVSGFQSLRDYWAPCHKQLQIRGTVAVVTDPDADKQTWDDMRTIWNQGWLDFAAHTVTHPTLSQLSEPEIHCEYAQCNRHLFALTGVLPRALVYPYGNYSPLAQQIASQYYVSARSTIQGGNAPDTNDYYEIRTQYVVSDTQPDDVNGWFNDALAKSEWLVLMSHAVRGIDDGWEPATKSVYERIFQLTRSNMDSGYVWTDFYENVALYLRERNLSRVVSQMSGDAIEVNLTYANRLDPLIYNQPLTIVTEVPRHWRSVVIHLSQARQETLAVRTTADGKARVMFEVIPDTGVVRIVPSP